MNYEVVKVKHVGSRAPSTSGYKPRRVSMTSVSPGAYGCRPVPSRTILKKNTNFKRRSEFGPLFYEETHGLTFQGPLQVTKTGVCPLFHTFIIQCNEISL